MTCALGRSSCIISSRLVNTRLTTRNTPVTLPPGRLMLDTRPVLTGSSPLVKTKGANAHASAGRQDGAPAAKALRVQGSGPRLADEGSPTFFSHETGPVL